MTLARQEYRLAGGRPSRRFEDRFAQVADSLAALRRRGDGGRSAGRREESGHQVRLVVDVDARDVRRQAFEDRAWPHTRLEHRKHEIGPLELTLRPLHAYTLDNVGRSPQARGIDYDERHAINLDRLSQCVARGACNRRDDRTLLARQAVQQARLADVWPSREDHVQATAQQAPLPAASEQLLYSGAQPRKARRGVLAVQGVDLLFRKVEQGF